MAVTDKEEDAVAGARWFSPRVDLGHLIQAVVVLAGVAGGLLLGYETLQEKYAADATRNALLEQRLAADERAIGELREALRSTDGQVRLAAAETRSAISNVLDRIADLRVAVVERQGKENASPRR